MGKNNNTLRDIARIAAVAGIFLLIMAIGAGCSITPSNEQDMQQLQLQNNPFLQSSDPGESARSDASAHLAYPRERFGEPAVKALAYGAVWLRDSLRPDREPYSSASQITEEVRANMISDMRRAPEAIKIMPVPVPNLTLDLAITDAMEQVGLWQIILFGLARQPSSVADMRPEDIIWAGFDVDYIRNVYQNGTRVREASVWLSPLCETSSIIDACSDSDGDGIPDAVDARLIAETENKEISISTSILAQEAIVGNIQLVTGLDGKATSFDEGEIPELIVEATDKNGNVIPIDRLS